MSRNQGTQKLGMAGKVRGTATKAALQTSFSSCGFGGWEGSRPEKSKEMGAGELEDMGKGKRDDEFATYLLKPKF